MGVEGLARPRAQARRAGLNDARAFLDKAREFLRADRDYLEVSNNIAGVGNTVHAGILAADAISTVRTRAVWRAGPPSWAAATRASDRRSLPSLHSSLYFGIRPPLIPRPYA